MPTISEQIESKKAELQAALAKLESADVAKLEAKRKTHEDAIAAIDEELSQIRATLGIDDSAPAPGKRRKRGSGPKVATPTGTVVTLEGLKKHIKTSEFVEDGKLSIRKAKLDTATVKALADANPKLLGYEKSAYPKVWLLK